jgi:hypothetical protein
MPTTAEVYVMFQVANLIKRFGIRPMQHDADLIYITSDKNPEGYSYFLLEFHGIPGDGNDEHSRKIREINRLLGADENGKVKVHDLDELEDRLDYAFSVAPRPRAL